MTVYSGKKSVVTKKHVYFSDDSFDDDIEEDDNNFKENWNDMKAHHIPSNDKIENNDSTNDDNDKNCEDIIDEEVANNKDNESENFKSVSIEDSFGSSGIENNLIDVHELTNTTQLLHNADILDFDFEDDHTNSYSSMETSEELSASLLMEKDIISVLEIRRNKRVDMAKKKYENVNLPAPVTSKKDLFERTKSILPVILRILNNEVNPSVFHRKAVETFQASTRNTLTTSDPAFNWTEFIAGYYGFKRQLFVASLIASEFRAEIRKLESTRKVVRFWTLSNYSTYVLANEVISRMVMEDLNCSLEDSELLILSTSDYGLYVTDMVDLVDDLGVGEYLSEESDLFMKGMIKSELKREADDFDSSSQKLTNTNTGVNTKRSKIEGD